MKKFKKLIGAVLTVSLAFIPVTQTYANVGDMGFFGGTSEGRRLPKTTDQVMSKAGTTKSSKNNSKVYDYKETVFLGGKPAEFHGTLTVKDAGPIDYVKNPTGTYKETYTVEASNSDEESDVEISRTVVFDVKYYKSGSQVIKDYTTNSWTESINTPDGEYELDSKQSKFSVSIIEDHTPGVIYYKGDISSIAAYDDGTRETKTGSFYGYQSPYSTTETHRIDGMIDWGAEKGQMQYQVRPSVTVDKTIVYGENEPQLTSFPGNYKEVISNESGLMYNIYITPPNLNMIDKTGQSSVQAYNTFEQLIAPDTNFLKGNFAEFDIKKLFAMSILEGDPKHYVPNQAITRGQYISMLAKAIKLDTSKYQSTSKSKVTTIVFPDVSPDRDDYKYIMAGFDTGLAIGRDNGFYYPDAPITREEAFVILLRTLGLSSLGLDSTPVTSFVDDAKISSWAKKDIYAAQRINLIGGDADGKVNPKLYISKAEAAALTNRLINYMRTDLKEDYGRNIVNFAN